MPANVARDQLAGRLRQELAPHAAREQRMFGGISFLVDGRLVLSARAGGALLVRVSDARHDDLVQRPGASAARMGERALPRGGIAVDPEHLDQASLTEWVTDALSH